MSKPLRHAPPIGKKSNAKDKRKHEQWKAQMETVYANNVKPVERDYNAGLLYVVPDAKESEEK